MFQNPLLEEAEIHSSKPLPLFLQKKSSKGRVLFKKTKLSRHQTSWTTELAPINPDLEIAFTQYFNRNFLSNQSNLTISKPQLFANFGLTVPESVSNRIDAIAKEIVQLEKKRASCPPDQIQRIKQFSSLIAPRRINIMHLKLASFLRMLHTNTTFSQIEANCPLFLECISYVFQYPATNCPLKSQLIDIMSLLPLHSTEILANAIIFQAQLFQSQYFYFNQHKISHPSNIDSFDRFLFTSLHRSNSSPFTKKLFSKMMSHPSRFHALSCCFLFPFTLHSTTFKMKQSLCKHYLTSFESLDKERNYDLLCRCIFQLCHLDESFLYSIFDQMVVYCTGTSFSAHSLEIDSPWELLSDLKTIQTYMKTHGIGIHQVDLCARFCCQFFRFFESKQLKSLFLVLFQTLDGKTTNYILEIAGFLDILNYFENNQDTWVLSSRLEQFIFQIHKIPREVVSPPLGNSSYPLYAALAGLGKDVANSVILDIFSKNDPWLEQILFRNNPGILKRDLPKIKSAYTKNNPISWYLCKSLLKQDHTFSIPSLTEYSLSKNSNILFQALCDIKLKLCTQKDHQDYPFYSWIFPIIHHLYFHPEHPVPHDIIQNPFVKGPGQCILFSPLLNDFTRPIFNWLPSLCLARCGISQYLQKTRLYFTIPLDYVFFPNPLIKLLLSGSYSIYYQLDKINKKGLSFQAKSDSSIHSQKSQTKRTLSHQSKFSHCYFDKKTRVLFCDQSMKIHQQNEKSFNIRIWTTLDWGMQGVIDNTGTKSYFELTLFDGPIDFESPFKTGTL